MAFLFPKTSINAAPRKAVITALNGKNRMFIFAAPMKSNRPARTNARVKPQPGHGKPAASLNKQGIEKDKWVTIIKYTAPAA